MNAKIQSMLNKRSQSKKAEEELDEIARTRVKELQGKFDAWNEHFLLNISFLTDYRISLHLRVNHEWVGSFQGVKVNLETFSQKGGILDDDYEAQCRAMVEKAGADMRDTVKACIAGLQKGLKTLEKELAK